jgi:hypothetical protein
MNYPNKAIINKKGLVFAYMPENASNELPAGHTELEITEENFKQINEIKRQAGFPVLIDGAFVDKREELKDYFVVPTRKNLNK